MSQIVKVVSDGTSIGTKVYDEKGNEITNISKVEFVADADSSRTEVKLTVLYPFEIQVSGPITWIATDYPKSDFQHALGNENPFYRDLDLPNESMILTNTVPKEDILEFPSDAKTAGCCKDTGEECRCDLD